MWLKIFQSYHGSQRKKKCQSLAIKDDREEGEKKKRRVFGINNVKRAVAQTELYLLHPPANTLFYPGRLFIPPDGFFCAMRGGYPSYRRTRVLAKWGFLFFKKEGAGRVWYEKLRWLFSLDEWCSSGILNLTFSLIAVNSDNPDPSFFFAIVALKIRVLKYSI